MKTTKKEILMRWALALSLALGPNVSAAVAEEDREPTEQEEHQDRGESEEEHGTHSENTPHDHGDDAESTHTGEPGHAEDDEHGEEVKGSNGGKLLRDGDVVLELAIFERGVPPEYRAWVTRDGKSLEKANLTVSLTRLGGRVDKFSFVEANGYWRGMGVVEEPHSFDVEARLELEGKTYRWQWESYEGRVEIAAPIAAKSGIGTGIAGPGTIERQILVYGRLVTPPDQMARLRARFPGVVTQLHANVGDTVKQGDMLATIESNESLRSYRIHAPIDGIVQSRAINVGEITGDQPLFKLINTDQLWAELKVFPGQRDAVKTGQTVRIARGDHESRIVSITPGPDDAPYVLARATLSNSDRHATPGDMVDATIAVERVDVPLAVDNRALQDLRDWTVVFIQVGDTYEIRPLELGRTDGRLTEVLGGLQSGDRYVVENSYLIKADIEKSGASHDH